jgi:hypothetical protein
VLEDSLRCKTTNCLLYFSANSRRQLVSITRSVLHFSWLLCVWFHVTKGNIDSLNYIVDHHIYLDDEKLKFSLVVSYRNQRQKIEANRENRLKSIQRRSDGATWIYWFSRYPPDSSQSPTRWTLDRQSECSPQSSSFRNVYTCCKREYWVPLARGRQSASGFTNIQEYNIPSPQIPVTNQCLSYRATTLT